MDPFISGWLYVNCAPIKREYMYVMEQIVLCWGWEGVLLDMGYIADIAMCTSEGYGFLAVWSGIVPILAALTSNTIFALES